MADPKTANVTDIGESKKRKRAAFTRNAKPLNILLTVGEDGKPAVALASYNAQDTLTEFVKRTQAGENLNLVTWVAPTKPKAPAPTAA
jgi:thiamine monophosphate kinase